MLKAEHICKNYNGTAVLKDVSLTVPDGAFVVILGASGSGKSTLLSVLSGLETPDSGTVDYNGQCVSAMNERERTAFRKREVGFIFQQYYLLSHLSVENNVRLGADLAGNRDYRAVIEAVGLGNKLRHKPSQLSGGEQQRTCIARALAKNAGLLFLDEPTGALDEQTGREVLDYIAKLQAARGFGLIMVTHNGNIADMAETVVSMNSGRIVDVRHNATRKSAYQIGW
ncbi:MAG: ABC transporter ATP-binding protein [Clostridia bacterium]|nr:ABC transporter ATP-binding protein [Clostridia bacterium]